jgi:two-component system sensor histidine kinase KdpD
MLVEIDPRLTSVALAHVIENAAHYSPPNTAIELKGFVDDEELRLSVTDQGPGVTPEELDRLFEPFFRGNVARELTSGSGMGLAIARGLLAAQGGRVWAENVAPRGARFSMAVPGRTRLLAATEAHG